MCVSVCHDQLLLQRVLFCEPYSMNHLIILRHTMAVAQAVAPYCKKIPAKWRMFFFFFFAKSGLDDKKRDFLYLPGNSFSGTSSLIIRVR